MKTLGRWAMEAIYPTRCGLCGEIGDLALCAVCASDFQANGPSQPGIEGVGFQHAVFRYAGRAAQAVRRLKYNRSTGLGRPMAETLLAAGNSLALFDSALIVPVPIHWTRRASRGFNQSEILCEAFDASLVDASALKRVRATKPQVGLTPEERQRNLLGAFVASSRVAGRTVLLIDDVVTTGETAKACAEALRAQGALEVGVLAFAGNPDDAHEPWRS